MTFITTKSKSYICPYWKTPITLVGKYRYMDETNKLKFMYAICPILENNKLPYDERDKSLSLYCKNDCCPCEGLFKFNNIIEY